MNNLKPYDRDTVHQIAGTSSSGVARLHPGTAQDAFYRVALYLMLRQVEDATADRTFETVQRARGGGKSAPLGSGGGGSSSGEQTSDSKVGSSLDDKSTEPTIAPR